MEPAVERLISHVEGNSDFVSPTVEEPEPPESEEAEAEDAESGDTESEGDAGSGADEHAEAGK
jgi:hypothetical protein